MSGSTWIARALGGRILRRTLRTPMYLLLKNLSSGLVPLIKSTGDGWQPPRLQSFHGYISLAKCDSALYQHLFPMGLSPTIPSSILWSGLNQRVQNQRSKEGPSGMSSRLPFTPAMQTVAPAGAREVGSSSANASSPNRELSSSPYLMLSPVAPVAVFGTIPLAGIYTGLVGSGMTMLDNTTAFINIP